MSWLPDAGTPVSSDATPASAAVSPAEERRPASRRSSPACRRPATRTRTTSTATCWGCCKSSTSGWGCARTSEAQLRDPFFVCGWGEPGYFLDYYRSRVSITIDERSSALTVHAEGLDPDFASASNSAMPGGRRALRQRVLAPHSPREPRLRRDRTRAGRQAGTAKAELLSFRTNQLFDPDGAGPASGAFTTTCRHRSPGRRPNCAACAPSSTKTRRRWWRFARSCAPCCRSSSASSASAGASGENDKRSERLNAMAIEFQGLQMQAEVAPLDAYKLAPRGGTHRIDAQVEEPGRPSSPLRSPRKPRILLRPYSLLTLLLGTLLILAVVRLHARRTVQEHQD